MNPRVPVVSVDGKPLMPTKASRARRWIKEGKAIPKWSKLGIFYVQLTKPAGTNTQEITLGLDPGSKFDGIALVSKKHVLLTGMIELPQHIAKKLEQRRIARRNRRYRKCRRRPARIQNRKRPENWLAPSQKAKIDFRLKIIEELKKLYPISSAVTEDVRFNHYKRRWNKYTSTAEIGKSLTYSTLKEWFNSLELIRGQETAASRRKYQVKKSPKKKERSVWSHAIDAVVMAANHLSINNFSIPNFYVWKRFQYIRRQLHSFKPVKGGIRRRIGGSQCLNFRKGDIVIWKGKLGRVAGYMENPPRLSLRTFDIENRRFTQSAKPQDCIRLFNQRIMYACSYFPQKEI